MQKLGQRSRHGKPVKVDRGSAIQTVRAPLAHGSREVTDRLGPRTDQPRLTDKITNHQCAQRQLTQFTVREHLCASFSS